MFIRVFLVKTRILYLNIIFIQDLICNCIHIFNLLFLLFDLVAYKLFSFSILISVSIILLVKLFMNSSSGGKSSILITPKEANIIVFLVSLLVSWTFPFTFLWPCVDSKIVKDPIIMRLQKIILKI